MPFFIYIRSFFHFFCFPNMMIYKSNIVSAKKKITIKELRGFIYKNCYSQIGFTKENCYYSIKLQKKKKISFATKLIEKIQDPSKTKEYCQSYLKKNTTK